MLIYVVSTTKKFTIGNKKMYRHGRFSNIPVCSCTLKRSQYEKASVVWKGLIYNFDSLEGET